MKRITVLFGNYGSGKTELSLNIALALKKKQEDVTLIDLDIVNPYFRSSEYKQMLEKNGIKVISPVYANTGIDLPTLPPDIYSAFSGGYAVFDCGGDPVGAAALGSLKQRFETVREQTQVLFVINTMRPFQDSADALYSSFEKVQTSARLIADGFVFNANLGKESTGRELVDGWGIACALAQKTGKRIAYVSGTKSALDLFKTQCEGYQGKFIELKIFTRPYWM